MSFVFSILRRSPAHTHDDSTPCEFCNRVHAFAPAPSMADFERMIELAFVLAQQTQPQGDRPTASMVLQSLKRRKADVEDVESERTCAVCTENLSLGEELCVLPCEHAFHDGCVKPWLEGHHTCPTCRFPMPTEDSGYNAEHVAPAARKFEEDRRSSRARVVQDIRAGKTPEMFKGKCINSAFRGRDCTSACAPKQQPQSEDAHPSASSSGPMVRLPCCEHVWHRCCLVHEQAELRRRHVLSTRPLQAAFVCPACRKVSDTFTMTQGQ